MKKIIFLILALAILGVCTIASAAQYQVDFAFTGVDHSGFTFYENVGGNRLIVLEDIDPVARSFDVELEEPGSGCRTFFMSPMFGDLVGPYSSGFGVCAEDAIPQEITIGEETVYELRIRKIQ